MTGKNLPFSFTEEDGRHCYVLVDCVLIDGFYHTLSGYSALHYKSLLAGTLDSNAAEFGPVLIEVKTDIHLTLTKQLLKMQQQTETPVWLSSEFDFVPLFNLLRSLLYVEREDGNQLYFRYYDWQCFAGFLAIVGNESTYAATIETIHWAIWQPLIQQYQYYHSSQTDIKL